MAPVSNKKAKAPPKKKKVSLTIVESSSSEEEEESESFDEEEEEEEEDVEDMETDDSESVEDEEEEDADMDDFEASSPDENEAECDSDEPKKGSKRKGRADEAREESEKKKKPEFEIRHDADGKIILPEILHLGSIDLSGSSLFPLGYGDASEDESLNWRLVGNSLGHGVYGTVYRAVAKDQELFEEERGPSRAHNHYVAKVFNLYKGFLGSEILRESESLMLLRGHQNVPVLYDVVSMPEGFVEDRAREAIEAGTYDFDAVSDDSFEESPRSVEPDEKKKDQAKPPVKLETPDRYGALVMENAGFGFYKELKSKGTSMAYRVNLMRRMVPSLLSVLATLHEAGIANRDLKTDNICLTEKGEIKLIDYGWSKRLMARNTMDVEIHDVRAPEIYDGDKEDYGTEIDAYAVGALAFSTLFFPSNMFPDELEGDEEEEDEEDEEEEDDAGEDLGSEDSEEEDEPSLDLVDPESAEKVARHYEEEYIYQVYKVKTEDDEKDQEDDQEEEDEEEDEEEEEEEDLDEELMSLFEEQAIDLDPKMASRASNVFLREKAIKDHARVARACAALVDAYHPGEGRTWHVVLAGLLCPNPELRMTAKQAYDVLEAAGLCENTRSYKAFKNNAAANLLKVPAWPHPSYTKQGILKARAEGFRWLETYAAPKVHLSKLDLIYAFELVDTVAHRMMCKEAKDDDKMPAPHACDDRTLRVCADVSSDLFEEKHRLGCLRESDEVSEEIRAHLLKDPEDEECWKFCASVAATLVSTYFDSFSSTFVVRMGSLARKNWTLEDLRRGQFAMFRAADFCVVRARTLPSSTLEPSFYYKDVAALYSARVARKLQRESLVL